MSSDPTTHLKPEPTPGQDNRPVDLQADSLLWLINRQVFHPRGYALAFDPDTGEFFLLGNGNEPWTFFGDGSEETHHLAKIKELMP